MGENDPPLKPDIEGDLRNRLAVIELSIRAAEHERTKTEKALAGYLGIGVLDLRRQRKEQGDGAT